MDQHDFHAARSFLSRRFREAAQTSHISVSAVAQRVALSGEDLMAVLDGRSFVSKTRIRRIIAAFELPPNQQRTLMDAWDAFADAARRVRSAISDSTSANDPHRLRKDVAGHDELEPDPLKATTKEEFLQCMRDFHTWAYEPSYRDIAIRAGKMVGASTLSEALNPYKPARLPSHKVVVAFIRGCGGGDDDLDRWTTAWRRLRMNKPTASNVTQLPALDQRQVS
ncbi:hypothetical protein [Nonomuraea dietziae]|uniref:hypothetical protein n=1 Tax=Nonomuraea dietziae TaxID=65515 RepID=UPI0033F3062A